MKSDLATSPKKTEPSTSKEKVLDFEDFMKESRSNESKKSGVTKVEIVRKVKQMDATMVNTACRLLARHIPLIVWCHAISDWASALGQCSATCCRSSWNFECLGGHEWPRKRSHDSANVRSKQRRWDNSWACSRTENSPGAKYVRWEISKALKEKETTEEI